MSLKRNSLIIFTAALMSFAAMAQRASICSDSLQLICKDNALQKKEEAIFLKQLKKEIVTEASVNAAQKIKEIENSIDEGYVNKRYVALFKAKFYEVMKSTKSRVGDFESVINNEENIDRIKEYMYQTVDNSKFDKAVKSQFKAIIKSIIVKTFTNFIEEPSRNDFFLGKFINNTCGFDGLNDRAFASSFEEDQRYVIVCPGFLLALKKTTNEAERFNTILHVISHEMGHHLDHYRVGSDIYNPYLKCLAENYGDQFSTNLIGIKCIQKFPNAKNCNMNATLKHAGELIADQWAVNVMALHLKSQNYSLLETNLIITDSMSKLCGARDEGVHPSGDFRIENLMIKNPSIIEAMGCNEVKTKPACTFDGAI